MGDGCGGTPLRAGAACTGQESLRAMQAQRAPSLRLRTAGVFLNVLQHCSTRFNVKFVRYEQSSSVRSSADSSVSYASAVVTVA